MPIYRAVGSALVSDQELIERRAIGKLHDEDTPVIFSTGTLAADDRITTYTTSAGKEVPFAPVGLGKPLTIEIRHVYTGQHPRPHWLTGGGPKDMVLTSAMKSSVSFNAAPRALNFIERDVGPNQTITSPAATEQGTALVHYAPALVDRSLVLTLEMGFNRFDQAQYDRASNFFTQASQLPVFITTSIALGSATWPASVLLLAGGSIAKIAGQLAERFVDSRTVFNATDSLSILRPGDPQLEAGFRVIFDREVSEDFRSQHQVTNGIRFSVTLGAA